ncbi:MAG: uroporphyrinogen-III C-methyltransferase [Gammaproteobacteria bacterium]
MNHDIPIESTPGTVSKTPSEGYNSPAPGAAEPSTESVAQPDEIKPACASKSARWATLFAILALLTALGLAGAGYFFLGQLHETEKQLTQRLEQADLQLTALQSDTQRLSNALSGEVDKRITTLQTTQQDLLNSVRALYAQVRQKTGVSTALAEAEYLVRSANNHLLLDRDVGTAITALTAADERLRATGDPDVLNIRGLIAKEINALSVLSQTDTPGLALSLSSLIDSVDQLPLTAQSSSPTAAKGPAKGEDWRSLPGNIWASLKSLVVVRYENKTTEPLIAPEQRYFLYQNLRLQLEAARLALLRRDAPTFRATLNTAHAWLKTYFDPNAAATRHMLDTLARLSATDISPPLPEISASLKALGELMEVNAASAAVTADEATSDEPTPSDATQPSPTPEGNAPTTEIPPLDNSSGMPQP